MSDYYRPSGLGGFSFFPPVIKNLLIINGVIFLIQVLGEKIAASSGLTLSDILTKYFALLPKHNVAPRPRLSVQTIHAG